VGKSSVCAESRAYYLRAPSEVWCILSLASYFLVEGVVPDVATTNWVLREGGELAGRINYLGNSDGTDAWGNPFRYAGFIPPTQALVYSCGQDGVSLTDGNDPDDLNSWGQHGQYYSKRALRRELLKWGTVFVGIYLGLLLLESRVTVGTRIHHIRRQAL
jgi:hypothetical protein